MSADYYDRNDPLFKPLTIEDVMTRTGRSRRTVNRWIKDGNLRAVQLDGQRVVVEGDVLRHEKQMRNNLKASRGIAPTSPSQSGS